MKVDLNADLGEGAPHDAELLGLVSSASIACGAHAGDAATMRATLRAAKAAGAAVGAHPGFADREHFGRREMSLPPGEITALVAWQLRAFAEAARETGARPRHMKPHGALYNLAARDAATARAIMLAVAEHDPTLAILAPQASALARAAAEAGLRVVCEVFADRACLADGSLVPRSQPGAVIHDEAAAAARAVRMVRAGRVVAIDGVEIAVRAETICIHGDSPGAPGFARQLRAALAAAGIAIAAHRP